MSKFYVIKYMPTGGYLPCPHTGFTASWVEVSTELPPRLFKDKRTASSTLTTWLKGGQTRTSPSPFSDEDYDGSIRYIYKYGRVKEDMVVIPVTIMEER